MASIYGLCFLQVSALLMNILRENEVFLVLLVLDEKCLNISNCSGTRQNFKLFFC